MAHFAEIDENNGDQRVIDVHNNELLDENGEEKEALGVAFCNSLLGGTWLQTSYNKNMRKNFAGIGFTYDSVRDAFIPPKPFDSWVLDEARCLWEAPVAYPSDENYYEWDETNTRWVEMTQNILE